MNTRTIISAFAAAFILASCDNQTDGYSIKGQINSESGTVYLQTFRNKMFFITDSATITNGTFSFKGKIEHPDLYGITTNRNESFSPYYIFLENSDITVNIDTANRRSFKVEGSPTNDLFVDYQRASRNRSFSLDSFIAANPASIVAAYVLYRDFSYRLNKDEIEHYIGQFDPSLHKTQYVEALRELEATLDRIAIGRKAPDFTLENPDGEPVSLYSRLGRSYVLVDFWAAWCGPCRRENPHVVEAYNTFKDKGFDVFGVSLDHNKEAWVKAIENDRLAWTQVSDLKFWDSAAAQLYGVRAIPSNFLIDKDGIIVAKNLRGDALDEKLKEYYQ